MAIDPKYIPAYSIETVILDKDTGAPLSGGEVLFEVADQPGTLKYVYQVTNTSGTYTYTQLPNPMTLSAIGTFEDDLGNPVIPYFYPYTNRDNPEDGQEEELYSVTVTSSGGVEQFVRNPQPYVSSDLDPSDTAVDYTNELENPQFADILFDGAGTTYSFTDAALVETEIAPGWIMVVSSTGTGTVTLTQVAPVGSLNIPTNPATMLTITSSVNITLLYILQRKYGSPNLFGSGYISGTLVGDTSTGTAVLEMNYRQSGSLSTVTPIMTNEQATLTTSFDTYYGNALMPASISADTYPDAYIDIYLVIPVETTVTITSIQVVSTGAVSVDEAPYAQDSLERQTDFLFNYYQPELNFKAIPSLLTGWDFPLNPRQLGTVSPVTSTAAYKMDQTIMKSITANFVLTQSSATGGITLVNDTASAAVLLLQYLSGAEAKKILGTSLSCNIESWSSASNVTARVYMYRGNSSAVIPTLPNLIGSLANTGVFTKNDTAGQGENWTIIARGNLGQASGTVAQVATSSLLSSSDVDLGFSGWEVTDGTEINNTDKYAIIVTYQIPTVSTTLQIQSISVVPGDIPTRPAPMTLQETLDDCQYYYRSSFYPGTTPAAGQALNNGETLMGQFVASSTGPGALGMIVQWDKPLRVNPTATHVTLYTPVTTGAELYSVTASLPWIGSTISAVDQSGFYVTGTSPASGGVGSVTACNWTADARLGII